MLNAVWSNIIGKHFASIFEEHLVCKKNTTKYHILKTQINIIQHESIQTKPHNLHISSQFRYSVSGNSTAII